MVVLYDYQIFQMQARGGVSRLFWEVISRYKQTTNSQARLFAGFHRSEYDLDTLQNHRLSVCAMKGQITPQNARYYSVLNRMGFWTYAQYASFDIYHPTYYSPSKLLKRKPTVITVLDMIHELFPSDFGTQDKTSERKHEAVRSADRVIAISEHTKKDLIEIFDVEPEKIDVVPLAQSLNWVDEGFALPNGKPYILYVGLRGGYKNFMRLLQAWQESRLYFEFDLVCFGGPELNSQEKDYLLRHQILECVHHLRGDDQVLAHLYRGAQFFVYPSMYEGFGIPPLEAMAMNCPVLAANVSSIPEVCGPSAVMYFDPSSTDDLIEKLKILSQDSQIRSDLVRSGCQQVKKFSWDKVFQDHLNCYTRLL